MAVKEFLPGAHFGILTPSYDFLCAVLGLGKGYRRKVLSILVKNSRGNILDAGCGTGTLGREIKRMMPSIELTGIDADERMIAIARRNAKKESLRIEYRKGLLQDLPFSSNHFHMVYSSLVFHHLPTPIKRKAAKEIFRVLKKNGVFVLSDFARPRGGLSSILTFLGLHFEEGEANYKGELPMILKEAGFQSIRQAGIFRHSISIVVAKK